MRTCDRKASQLTPFVPDCAIASYVSPGEGILVLDKNMQNLGLGDSSANKPGVACSPVHVQSNAEPGAVSKSQTGSTPPSPPVPDDCIMKDFITIFPHHVWKGLIIKLDPLDVQGNYKDLASELGFNMEKILYIQSLKNPTEGVLISHPITIEELCTKLAAIGRSDAKLLIKEWVKSQDCKCAACSN